MSIRLDEVAAASIACPANASPAVGVSASADRRLSVAGGRGFHRAITITLATVAAAAIVAPSGAAMIDLTDDRGLFEASLADAVIEDFEDESLGVLAGPTTLGGSSLTVGLEGAGWDLAVTDSSTFSYNTTDGGAQHLRSAFGSGDWTLVLETPVAVTAFGFSITGFQDLAGTGGLGIELFDDGASVAAFVSADEGGFFERFHGIWSDVAFDEVRITVSGNDIAGIDDVAFAIVPGPSAAALLTVGLGFAGRRRRRA